MAGTGLALARTASTRSCCPSSAQSSRRPLPQPSERWTSRSHSTIARVKLRERVLEELEALGHGSSTSAPTRTPSASTTRTRRASWARRSSAATPSADLVCGSGVGASIAACKLAGIRAAICHDVYSAHQGVEHDDMNVLCLGSR